MLVLTRRQGESIIIGEGIKLTVVSVGPGRVKIGITAPPNVRIDREEIHTRIQQEQSSDVLEAVSSGAMQGQQDQNTLVTSPPETILHNRVGDKLPDQAHVVSTASPTPPYRPRKPR